MPDQLEPDFQAIDRARDLPPDEKPYDWADPELWNEDDDEPVT